MTLSAGELECIVLKSHLAMPDADDAAGEDHDNINNMRWREAK